MTGMIPSQGDTTPRNHLQVNSWTLACLDLVEALQLIIAKPRIGAVPA